VPGAQLLKVLTQLFEFSSATFRPIVTPFPMFVFGTCEMSRDFFNFLFDASRGIELTIPCQFFTAGMQFLKILPQFFSFGMLQLMAFGRFGTFDRRIAFTFALFIVLAGCNSGRGKQSQCSNSKHSKGN
jgi:hypothetical protein